MQTDRAPVFGWWQRFTSDLPLKIGAVLLSVLLWYAATEDRRATVTRTLELPLIVQGLSAQRAVSDLPQNVKATVRGPRATLENLEASNLEATIDVSALLPGLDASGIDLATANVRLSWANLANPLDFSIAASSESPRSASTTSRAHVSPRLRPRPQRLLRSRPPRWSQRRQRPSRRPPHQHPHRQRRLLRMGTRSRQRTRDQPSSNSKTCRTCAYPVASKKSARRP